MGLMPLKCCDNILVICGWLTLQLLYGIVAWLKVSFNLLFYRAEESPKASESGKLACFKISILLKSCVNG